MTATNKSLKASFNYRSWQLKQSFKEKISVERNTTTAVINDLIENYIDEKSSFSQDEIVRNIVMKLLLLINADEPNFTVIKKELERLWELIQ